MAHFKHLGKWAGIVVGAMMSCATAKATCILSDAAGNWSAFVAINTNLDLKSYAFTCDLAIKASGKINDTNCLYLAPGNPEPLIVAVANGKITLADGGKCQFGGKITIANKTHTLVRGTMSKEKTFIEGVGSAANTVFRITLLKR